MIFILLLLITTNSIKPNSNATAILNTNPEQPDVKKVFYKKAASTSPDFVPSDSRVQKKESLAQLAQQQKNIVHTICEKRKNPDIISKSFDTLDEELSAINAEIREYERNSDREFAKIDLLPLIRYVYYLQTEPLTPRNRVLILLCLDNIHVISPHIAQALACRIKQTQHMLFLRATSTDFVKDFTDKFNMKPLVSEIKKSS